MNIENVGCFLAIIAALGLLVTWNPDEAKGARNRRFLAHVTFGVMAFVSVPCWLAGLAIRVESEKIEYQGIRTEVASAPMGERERIYYLNKLDRLSPKTFWNDEVEIQEARNIRSEALSKCTGKV